MRHMLELTPDPRYSIAQRADGGIELTVPSQLGLERVVRDAAAAIARRMGFSDARVHDIETVVAEATLNAMEHGNALDRARLVRVLVIPSATALELQVWDESAAPFQPDRRLGALPSLADKLDPTRPGRGWGLFLIESLADEVDYASTPIGNRIRVRMYLGEQNTSAAGAAAHSG